MLSSRNGHSEMVDKLLDKGANIEASNKVQLFKKTLFDIDVDRYLDVIDLS